MRFPLKHITFSLLLPLLLCVPVHAQKSVGELESRIKQVGKSSNENKKQILNALEEALNEAEKYEANQKDIKAYKKRIEQAPAKLEQVRENPPKPSFKLTPPEDISRRALESQLSDVRAELDNQREQHKKFQDTLTDRITRRSTISGQIANIRNEINETEIRSGIGASSELEKARQEFQLQKRRALESELEKLKTEEDTYLAENALLNARSHVARVNVEKLNEIQNNWQKALLQKRIEEAEAALKEARILASTLSDIPALSNIAESNASLAEMRSGPDGLSAKMASINSYRTKLEEKITHIGNERKNAERRIRLLEDADLGIDSETGDLLRKQRMNIPDTDKLRDDLKNQLSESAKAQLELLKLDQMAAQELTNIDSRIEELYEATKDKGVKKETIKKLLTQRRELIDNLNSEYNTYYRNLTDTIDTTKEAIAEFSDYALFLDERLLWIPSTEPIQAGELKTEFQAITKIFTPSVGGDWLEAMLEDMRKAWPFWSVVLVITALLFIKRPKIIKNLTSEGNAATKRNCSSFKPTAKALLNALALTLPIPLMAGFLAWRTESTSPFFPALLALTNFSFTAGFFRRLSRPHSILESHIHFGSERTQVLYKHLMWYLPTMLPIVFITYLLLHIDLSSSGRLSFIIMLLVSAVFLILITKPSNKVLCSKNQPSRLAKVAHILAYVLPLGLIVGAALGYLSSVRIIHGQLLLSLIIILGTLLTVSLLLRWGLVSRRNLAIRQALKRREIALAERKKKEQEDGESGESSASDIPTLEEVKAKAVDVAEVQEKTTRLIKVGAACALAFSLWAVWSTSMPALSFLDNVKLWGQSPQAKTEKTTTSTSPTDTLTNMSGNSSSTDSSNSESESSGSSLPTIVDPEKDGVTLQDLLIFFIALFLTYTAARNIPSLLELTLLSKLDLKPGGSFAVTTAITYSIVVVGILISFAQIGITWSKVQWIAAAVTLGIGFGLQEVFANFVAGLILLFERPIRLGDFITVGDVSGRVTQIRIRATTIQQLNNRELVVPNKEFITGQVVNWTLKDALLRAEVVVGIAYGSDTELAKQELLKVAEENPRVVSSEKADVMFSDFGDSTLNFTLRCFVNGIDDFIPVQSELRFAIDKSFREHDIEIAFPQRDIHIRSVTNLAEALKEQAKEVNASSDQKK